MLSNTQLALRKALNIYPSWSALSVTIRAQCLQRWAELLPKQLTVECVDSLVIKMIEYQSSRAIELISQAQIMTGHGRN
ncbi:hypothetical protein [Psychromonas sp. MME2]|uniref:hypothetical protein n=1 Tax=Psychromonas sp. MME2 TaxID=3231033 RepID=UPI00339BA1EF